MAVSYNILLKSTKNFNLYKTKSVNIYPCYLITRILGAKDEVNILIVQTDELSKETYLTSYISNIQDYIIDFDLYSNDSNLINKVKKAFIGQWDSYETLKKVRVWFENLSAYFSINTTGKALAQTYAKRCYQDFPDLI